MTFWLLSLLLLIPALLIFLLPVLKVRKYQSEEDRTALNVALYQERIAELESQHAAGVLDIEQLEQGKAEAGRDLLEDTEKGAPVASASLGMALPFIAALLIPISAAALYMVWGESDKVAVTLSMQEQPQTAQEAIVQLENLVRVQPESTDAWYFLGRTYMSEQQPAKAAKAYAKTMELAGRQPEILAQWAQAKYFADDKQWSLELQDAVDSVLAVNPMDATTLGFVGIAAYESGHFDVALEAWSRLLEVVDVRDPSAQAVVTGIERAEEGVKKYGVNNPEAQQPAPVLPALPDPEAMAGQGRIKIKVELGESLSTLVQAEDVVFVFARSEQSGQVPLAAQRLSVAQLPQVIELSDADALMPELLLSKAADVQLQASIASDGNASAPQWVSELVKAETETENIFKLVIEHAVSLHEEQQEAADR